MIRCTPIMAAASVEGSVLIGMYTKPFESFPSELDTFAKENGIKLPGIKTLRGQGIALLAQPENRGQRTVCRNLATTFFANIGYSTKDSIQGFNKATGLKMANPKKGLYCLKYPFEADTIDIIKRQNVRISGNKEEQVAIIKSFWAKNLFDIPAKDWQIGHLDPTVPDSSEDNLAYQPPIQGKWRDRFKFDKMFMKMWPTAKELEKNIDEYYTREEQLMMLRLLQSKFPM